jgi:transcriptional regulator with XRE-family HTH domain
MGINVSKHMGNLMDYLVQTPHQLQDQLRALRRAKGLTQKQLSVMLGVDQTRISDIENKPGAVNVAQFLRLLAALDVRIVLSSHPILPAASNKLPPR